MRNTGPQRVWTVAEAKARLSEILRLAESEGPQRIGTRRPFVVVPAETWDTHDNPRKPLGQWLIENVRRSNSPIATRAEASLSPTKTTSDRVSPGYERALGKHAPRAV